MADNPGSTGQSLQYRLELEGVSVGSLSSVDGGDAIGDVVVEKVGQDRIVHKHLGGVRYEDISITCGADMANGFYDWLQQTFSGRYDRKNGVIVVYDFNGHEVSRLSFFNALVSEIGFPALDASSEDAAKLTIKISPEYTRTDAGSSQVQGAVSKGAKGWVARNFRLAIDGVEYARANRVEAITVSRSIVSSAVGEVRDYEKEPTYLLVPDLTVTLADLSTDPAATALHKWFASFVVGGNNDQSQEKNGTLEYLSSDLRTVFFTLDLRQLGIYRLTPVNDGDSSQTVRRMLARMYCEEMVFSYGSNAAATAGTQPSTNQGADRPVRFAPSRPVTSVTVIPRQAATPANQGAAVPGSVRPVRDVVAAGTRGPRNLTPAQGPRDLPALQEQALVPSPPPRTSLLFRNLAQ